MPCVREFLLPDLGEGLQEAEVVRWLVEVGEMVKVDQPVVEVETAKAVIEVPCPFAGVVSQVHAASGQSVPVGSPLVAVLVEDAEEAEPARVGSDGAAVGSVVADSGSGNVLVGYGTSPEPRRRARLLRPGPEEPPRVVSPMVRRLAQQHGLDLREVDGTGPGGLIVRTDVDRVIARRSGNRTPAEQPEPVLPSSSRAAPTEERVPLRGVRGAAAAMFTRSRAEIPDATCWVDADATELVAARQTLGVGLLPLLARISLAALARFPQFNAETDAARQEIVRHRSVNLGFAAQTPRGLLVPVVHGADRLGTTQLAGELGRLTAEARAGTLPPAALGRGTFTLNNYGVFGVDGSTPILNAPQAAMLGVGRLLERPWVHRGELAVRTVVQLSFTFDHRVCDGAEAAGFLRCVADAVEQPLLLLREL